MPRGQDKVTPNQVAIGLISTVIGVQILAMPRDLAEAAGRDGWISVILGGLIVGVIIYFLTVLGAMFPGKSIVEYSQEILGRILGILYSLIVFAFYALVAAFVVREFADILKLYLLDKTPVEVIILSMLFVSAYLVNHGVNSLVRVMQVFFPLLVLPLLLLFVMVTPMADFKQLLPPLQKGVLPVLKGVTAGFTIYSGFSVIGFLIPFMEEPRKAIKVCLLAQGLIMAVYLAMFIMSLGVFGPVDMTHLLFPVNDLVRTIEVPGTFIERFDVFLLSIWILAAYTTVTAAYFLTTLSLSQITGLGEPRPLVYLVLPVIYVVAMRPQDITALDAFGRVAGMVSMGLSLTVPLLLIVALLKEKGKDKNE
ncbi:GerAB/ArcD/ProY family transporter [Zhaonella formicivorans]|uniref:GerAB/ArcD/ProY family transporter n=1 Tax=Zhaonella formicivorans TaxID=2528593 RepID=UPI0010EA2631|nr:endospore germination permease [Zhaonella formicivorans]